MLKMCSRKCLFFSLLFIGSICFTVLSQEDDADENAPDVAIADPVTEAPEETTAAATETSAAAGDDSTPAGTGTTDAGTGTTDAGTGTGSTADESAGTGSDASPGASPGPTPTTPTGEAECTKNNTAIAQQKRECRSSCSESKKCKNVKAQCLCDGACGKVCIPPELKCRKPVDIEHGKVSLLEGVLFDAAATYHCDEGFEIVGPEERTCQGDVRWSGEEPFCTPEGSRCKPPDFDVANATLVVAEEKTEYYVGDYAVYKCDEGFTPDGDVSEIECISPKPKIAEWTPLNLTCIALCLCSNLTSNLTDKGLETSECEELASSGDLVQLKCVANYSNPTGPLIAECVYGEWKPMDTECLKMCSCDELRSSLDPSLDTTECADFIGSGTILEVECSRGYVNMTGAPEIECMEGEWMMNDTFCHVPDPSGLMRDCTYLTESNNVQAFYQGKFLSNSSPIPHSGNISLRCSNVQNLKFVGKRVLQCIDGKFNDAMPECNGLIPDSKSSAPPLWLTVFPRDYPKVNEEGTIVVPRGSAVSITCWWTQGQPDVAVTGDVKPKSQKHQTFNKISGFTTEFDTINEISNVNYSCGVPGSEPGGKLTQFLQLKVSDTCRMIESKVEQYGLMIDPQSNKYLYAEEDRVDLKCGGLVKKGIQYMVCKRNGKWEWGPEEDCPEKETEAPTTEAKS